MSVRFGCCGPQSSPSAACGCAVIAGANVTVTGVGTAGSPYVIAATGGGSGPSISTDAGNQLTNGTDGGLYVPDDPVASAATSTVALAGLGTTASPLTATAKLSATAGNILTANADGLYATEAPLASAATATVNLAGLGTTASPLTATAKLSATAGNAVIANADGLYVPASKPFDRLVFVSPGAFTYTKPAGATEVRILCLGAGGAGGNVPTSAAGEHACGGGGQAGGYTEAVFPAASLGATETVTVGTGGATGAAGATDGADGTASSVGALINAPGGQGGKAGLNSSAFTTSAGGALTALGTTTVAGIRSAGAPGGAGFGTGTVGAGGQGGSSFAGGGGASMVGSGAISSRGGVPNGSGAGGGGAISAAGGAGIGAQGGRAGLVVIDTYF